MEEVTLFVGNAGPEGGGRYSFTLVAVTTQSDDAVEFQLYAVDENRASLFKANFIATDAQTLRVSAWTQQAAGRFAFCVAFNFGLSVLDEVYRAWTDSRNADPALNGKARWDDVLKRLHDARGNFAVAAAKAVLTCALP